MVVCRSPPLPYVVRFTLELVDVEPPKRCGPWSGAMSWATRWAGDRRERHRCRLHLVSDLAPGNSALQIIAAAARPVVRRGHDWVLDTGAEQFVERAL